MSSPTRARSTASAPTGEADGRLRRLAEAGIALASESSLDGLLHRVVELAAELAGARAAAIDVLHPSVAPGLVVGFGFEPVVAARDEGLPGADGAAGARRFLPAELAASGSVAVPVVVRGSTFGNLYVFEKLTGEGFARGDEELLSLLAAQGAVAIENVRLVESARRWSWQLESLNEVSRHLTGETELGRLLDLTVGHLRELLGVRGVMVALPTSDGRRLVVEAAAGEVAPGVLGMQLEVEHSKMGQAFRYHRSERIDSIIDDPEIDQAAARIIAATSTLVVPLLLGDRVLAVAAAWDKQGGDTRLTDADLRLAEAFADRAAVAIELTERVSRHAVERLLEGQERERTRIARDLHDQTLHGLALIRHSLASVEEDAGPDVTRAALGGALEQIDEEVANIRALIADLRPPGLNELGSEAAPRALVEGLVRFGLNVSLEIDLDFERGRAGERHEPELETAIIRIVQESLHNVSRHPGVEAALVRVTESGPEVEVVVQDRGRGFDLLEVEDRFGLLGGRLEIESAPQQGTTIRARLPVRRRGLD